MKDSDILNLALASFVGVVLYFISNYLKKNKKLFRKIRVKDGSSELNLIIPRSPSKREVEVIRSSISREFIEKEEKIRGNFFDIKQKFKGKKGEVEIIIFDDTGSEAILRQVQVLESIEGNVDKLTEIITAEGKIEPNFSTFDNVEIRSEEGFNSGVYTLEFKPKLKKGQEFKYQTEVSLKNSFLNSTEYWRVNTQIGFEEYQILIRYPLTRKPSEFRVFGIKNYRLSPVSDLQILKNETSNEFKVSIDFPTNSEQNIHYLIEWDW